MLKTILLIFLCLHGYLSKSQSESKHISGQVLDKMTKDPVPFTHIVGKGRQVITNANGEFSIPVNIGDTLTFSHINFERNSILITDISERKIMIYLNAKENLLKEIVIRDYLPEEEFKQEIIKRKVQYTEDEVNAIQNVEYSTILYKKGYVPEMNSLDNFKNYMKEPQGVTLFSSDPSKGLIKSIQRLSQQDKNSSPNRTWPNKTDTTTIYRFYFLPD